MEEYRLYCIETTRLSIQQAKVYTFRSAQVKEISNRFDYILKRTNKANKSLEYKIVRYVSEPKPTLYTNLAIECTQNL